MLPQPPQRVGPCVAGRHKTPASIGGTRISCWQSPTRSPRFFALLGAPLEVRIRRHLGMEDGLPVVAQKEDQEAFVGGLRHPVTRSINAHALVLIRLPRSCISDSTMRGI